MGMQLMVHFSLESKINKNKNDRIKFNCIQSLILKRKWLKNEEIKGNTKAKEKPHWKQLKKKNNTQKKMNVLRLNKKNNHSFHLTRNSSSLNQWNFLFVLQRKACRPNNKRPQHKTANSQCTSSHTRRRTNISASTNGHKSEWDVTTSKFVKRVMDTLTSRTTICHFKSSYLSFDPTNGNMFFTKQCRFKVYTRIYTSAFWEEFGEVLFQFYFKK